jgi:hypothetical protein
VADHDGMILVRDTKDRGHGPVHWFTRAGWEVFTAGVRADGFKLDEASRLP